MTAPRVILFTRPGCHLCDAARAVLESEAIAFHEADITADPGLEAEYGTRIPVVEVAGQPVFEAGMDPMELPDLLEEA
jgi:glutaredoxin